MHIYGNDKQVKGNSSTDIVSALQKFTIPEAKYLQVELFERNGGRNLNMDIKNKTIVNGQAARMTISDWILSQTINKNFMNTKNFWNF